MRPSLVLTFLLFALFGCSPCARYCERSCSCQQPDDASCAEQCLANLDVYTQPFRDDRCVAFEDEMDANEECMEAQP